MRKIDPQLETLSDAEVEELRASFYEIAQLTFDVWWEKNGSKNPVSAFPFDKLSDNV